MHWLLQADLFKDDEWTQLVGALDRFGLPYSVHEVVPFVGELRPAPVLQATKAVCLGSYSMRHAARAHGWTPGVYDLDGQDFVQQREAWGDRLLNADACIQAFRDIRLDRPTFLRPVDDSKFFTGGVFAPNDFETWRRRVCDLGDLCGISLTPDTLLQVCTQKTIHAECRFWVVGGQIVTCSLYKRGSRVVYSSDVDPDLTSFVRRAVADWQPHRAFVLDACHTPDGPRIVEINTLNAAGFYAGDVQRIVAALEELEA